MRPVCVLFGLDKVVMCAIFGISGIHKGDCDVSNTGGGWQAFVVVGEAAWVHEGPAFARSLNGAVVAEKPASTTLVIKAHLVECNVYSECGGIMVWPQRRLLIWFIPNYKGQVKLSLGVVTGIHFLCYWCNVFQ